MYLIHYVMGWIVLPILSMFFLPVWSELKVIQPYKVMGINGTAKVQCLIDPQPSYNNDYSSDNQNSIYPYPEPQEIRVSLIQGLHGYYKFCSNTLNLLNNTWVDMAKFGECSAKVTEGGLEVTVSGLQAIHTDLYRCKIEVLFPPPYLRLIGNGTLIHVLESPACQEQQGHMLHLRNEEDGAKDPESQISPPVVLLATLVMFVLMVIIFIQIIQCQHQRRYAVGTNPNNYC